MSVLAVDVGTSRVKAVLFDDDWQVTASRARTAVVSRPRQGWSEQDPDAVWDAVADVVAGVATAGTVDAVAVTAQGDGCWLIDATARPARPAVLWNDGRARAVVDRWFHDGTADATFRTTGCAAFPGQSAAVLRWLQDHEPDSLKRAATLLSCGSWVFSRLTGRQVLQPVDAGLPFLDASRGSYAPELLDAYGLDTARHLLPPLVCGPDAVAPLLATAAGRVGLPAGLPVHLSPYDVLATTIGVGAVAPDTGTLVLGTTICASTTRTTPRLDRPVGGLTLPVGLPDLYLLAYPTLAGTQVLDWFAALLQVDGASGLAQLAASTSSAGGPLLLPYLSPAGERAPGYDPQARGALLGLTLEQTPADVASSVLRGLVLAVLDCFAAAGAPSRVAVAGGGARSEWWCQAVSDALAVPVLCAGTAETGARGAALSAGVALGHFQDLADATARTVREAHVHQPDQSRHADYLRDHARVLDARAVAAQHL